MTCVSGAQSGSTAGLDRPQQDDDDGRSVGRPDSAGTSTETSTVVSTAAATTRGVGGSYDGPGPTYVNYTANDDTVHSAAPAATGNRPRQYTTCTGVSITLPTTTQYTQQHQQQQQVIDLVNTLPVQVYQLHCQRRRHSTLSSTSSNR